MQVKSSLQVRQQGDIEGRRGVVEGQTYQSLIGVDDRPTDRVRIGRATYLPGTLEQLHWHPIEALYYVISGEATVRDVEGNEYPVSAGSFVYAPAGLAGAHEWHVKDALELLDIRATNVAHKKMQFWVDRATLRSYIDIDELFKREGIQFPSHY